MSWPSCQETFLQHGETLPPLLETHSVTHNWFHTIFRKTGSNLCNCVQLSFQRLFQNVSILRYFDTHPSSYWTSSTLMSTLPTIHLLFNNWTFALQVTKQVTTNITAVHINQPCIDSGLCYFIVITSNLHLGFWYSQVISESWLMKCLCCKQHVHRLVDFFSYCS